MEMDEDAYNCSFNKNDEESFRGIALIITMGEEREGSEIKKELIREGAIIERVCVERLAEFLRFEVQSLFNCNASDVKERIKRLSKLSLHKDRDCFVCFVNAHGGTDSEGNHYILDNNETRLLTFEDIMKPFLESRHLENKPKVFFLNACRGGKCLTTDTRLAGDSSLTIDENEIGRHKIFTLLQDRKDVLAVYSTDIGDKSWRDRDYGSQFIKFLTEKLLKFHNTEDLVSIVTRVNNDLSNMKAVDGENRGVTQTLVQETKLTKKLYWRTSKLMMREMEFLTENLVILSEDQEPDLDIVFFNCFEFPNRLCVWSQVSAWLTMKNNICWPVEWLPSKEGIVNPVRVLAVKLPYSQGAQQMKDITKKLMEELKLAKLGQRRPLFLIGHSVGGFIIQSLLCEHDNPFERNLLGAAFYDSPCISGSTFNHKSWLMQLDNDLKSENAKLDGGMTIEALESWLTSDIGNARSKLPSLKQKGKILCFARHQDGEDCKVLNNTHLNICRPTSKKDDLFTSLVQFIKDRYEEFVRTNKHEREGALKEMVVASNIFGQKQHLSDMKKGVLTSGAKLFAITGMGGIGKSTLAKTLFNDLEVQHHFQVFWLEIKDDPDIGKKQKSLLEKLGRKPPKIEDQDVLKEKIQQCFKDVSPFMLVLDDVWSQTHIENILGSPLQNVIPDGCTCLITTRIQKEAKVMLGLNDPIIELDILNKDDSSKLFCLHAFGEERIPLTLDLDLVVIVEQTIKACGNLPIVLEAIGAERRRNIKIEDWKMTLNKVQKAGKIDSDKYNQTLATLQLSYDSLPEDDELDLKGVFLDFAAYEKYEEVLVDWLLEKWPPTFKSNGLDPLRSLEGRCIIKISKDDRFCYMHDIFRRLAKKITEGNVALTRSLFAEGQFPPSWCLENEGSNGSYAAKKLFLKFVDMSIMPPMFLNRLSNLKVLVLHMSFDHQMKLPHNAFTGLPVLELLHLKGYRFSSLPSSITDLPNLQDLNLDYCLMKKLPAEMGNLRKLEVLHISMLKDEERFSGLNLESLPTSICNIISLKSLELLGCSKLQSLPSQIGKCVSLEFLELINCSRLKKLPTSIGNLNRLRSLRLHECKSIHKVPSEIGKCVNLEDFALVGCHGIEELPTSIGNLKRLEALWIAGFNLKNLPTSIGNLQRLKSLQIQGYYTLKKLPTSIGNLQRLESLQIQCYELKKLPTSIGNLQRLESLRIECYELKKLPTSIGNLKCLQTLKIKCSDLQNIPYEIGDCTSLEILKLIGNEGLQELPSSLGKLASLEVLKLSRCPNLKHLPDGIRDLRKLQELDLRYCNLEWNHVNAQIKDLLQLKKVVVSVDQQIAWTRTCDPLPETVVTNCPAANVDDYKVYDYFASYLNEADDYTYHRWRQLPPDDDDGFNDVHEDPTPDLALSDDNVDDDVDSSSDVDDEVDDVDSSSDVDDDDVDDVDSSSSDVDDDDVDDVDSSSDVHEDPRTDLGLNDDNRPQKRPRTMVFGGNAAYAEHDARSAENIFLRKKCPAIS